MVWKSMVPKKNCHLKGQCKPDAHRYARSIKDPAGHGLCQRDYDSRHVPRAWPGGSEYHHAYCSNYNPPSATEQQHQQQQQRFHCLESHMRQQRQHYPSHHNQQQQQQQQQQQRQQSGRWPCSQRHENSVQDQQGWAAQQCLKQQQQQQQEECIHGQQTAVPAAAYSCPGTMPVFPLYDPTPAPLLDKHYRGAHYRPGEPLGVQVPEELSRVRETSDGPKTISCQEDMSNVYLPLYRYKDWVQRSELEVWRDCNTDSIKCRLPDAPTQFWDFYNQVRMNRPAQTIPTSQYQTCRVVPIPRDVDLESATPPYGPYAGHNYGRFKDYKFEEAAFQATSMCLC